MSYTDTPEYKLQQMADELLRVADKNPALSKLARRASYAVEDLRDAMRQRTAMAVGEVVQIAAHRKGVVGPVASRVLRERATV